MIPIADRHGLAFYNEINDYAADWLENLIENGLIAEGVVSRKSITELEPDDVQGYTQCHFFAGIGGWSLAARMAGWDDARPIWTGSAPCQPFSAAGKGKRTDDPRHLWPHFHRLIDAIRPPCIVGEQVAQQAGYDWINGVGADLEASAFEWRAMDIAACAVDSPQQRQRLYWVAIAMAESERAGWGPRGDYRSGESPSADRGIASNQSGGSDGSGGQPMDRAQGKGSQRQRSGSAAAINGAGTAGSIAKPDVGDLECAQGIGRGQGIDQSGLWPRGRQAIARPDGESDLASGDGIRRGPNESGRGSKGRTADGRPDGGAEKALDSTSGIGRIAGRPDNAGNERDIAIARNQDGGQGPMASGHGDIQRRVTPSRKLPVDEYNARSDFGRNRSWWGDSDWIICHDGKGRRVADASASMLVNGIRGNLAISRPSGISAAEAEAERLISRIGAWSGFGNAIVPQLAAEVLAALMEVMDE